MKSTFDNMSCEDRAEGGLRLKMRVVSLVDKNTCKVRSIGTNATVKDEVANVVRENVARESVVVTDEALFYK